MVTAISHGKVNLQDFSAAFANIVPAASAAGISFNDVGAALATMTNHGFTAQRGSQNLAQALRSLLNPTNPMKKAFDQFGVSAATLKSKLHGPNGLTDAMEYLSTKATKAGKEGTPEFAAALKRLMGTASGANAALTTTGENFKQGQRLR
jgi:TP901 family phage tail tape measure protein